MRHPDGRRYSARGNQGAGLHGSSLSISLSKERQKAGERRQSKGRLGFVNLGNVRAYL